VSSDDPLPRASARSRLGVGAAIVVVLLALGVTVVVGIVRASASPAQTVSVDTAPGDEGGSAGVASATIYVHVLGAVTQPGLYLVPEGSRVVDAVSAAGGFAPEADRGAVNLARPVADGEQLVVPLIGEAPPVVVPGAAAPGGPAGDGRVNLNTADAAALDTLPRIGPALAERILRWREDNGRFTSVDDLLAVPGIGEKMLESLRDLVTV
jgi:competence protein ComEA